jgi:hypothetical protein
MLTLASNSIFNKVTQNIRAKSIGRIRKKLS